MVQRSKQSTIRNRRQNEFNNVVIKLKICVFTGFHLTCLKTPVALQRIKMRYLIEPSDRIYVKNVFLSFAKSMGKSLRNKYGQKRFDSAEKSTTDATETTLKRAIQKTAEATGDLIGNKIADRKNMCFEKTCDGIAF